MTYVLRITTLVLLTAAVSPRAIAQEPGDRAVVEGVPAALAPWIPWVRATDEAASCPVRDGRAVCFWPGALALELADRDGRFAFEVLSDRRQLVRLPGGAGRWPLSVRVAGKAAPVLEQGGVPVLDLAAGAHRVEGRFAWAKLPDRLPVPAEFGQLQLTLAGKRVAHPKRDESGSLWLQRAASEGGPAQLELVVQRKIEDAVPLRVETRIRIRAAGEPREINLGNVLIDGTVPLSIETELPVRLDPSGELRLSVRAGSYTLRVVARTTGPVRELASRARPAPWPAQEAWVFQPDPALRQVRIEGAPAVDPARLELDADLRGLPTYLVAQTDKLTLSDVRRGEPEPAPNQLSLERTMWLDQDGRGYTVHDALTGELHSGFRLELREGRLGRASQANEDQLITQRTAAGPLGVELREVAVRLDADSRLEDHVSSLPAVGWSEDVRSLGVTLLLPPGYTLWAVRGVDEVDRSWLGDWDLLGFFFVLVIAFGTAGIAGKWAGVLALFALGLTYQESDAPSVVWLVLLVAAALLRVLPRGRFWQLVRAVFVVGLFSFAVVALPFAARSLREALHPQLASQQGAPPVIAPVWLDEPSVSRDEAAESAMVQEELSQKTAPTTPEAIGGGAVQEQEQIEDGALRSRALSRQRSGALDYDATPLKKARVKQDPDAVVQTGPGLPDWRFQSWQLRWSGPVARDHRFELTIVPPLLNRALCVLRVVLCGALLWFIVGAAGAFRRTPPIAAAVASLFIALSLGVGDAARAQFPDPALLEQLRARALRAPECRPHCVRVANLELRIGPDGLQLTAEVHAQDRTSVRVPGPLGLWSPESVRLNGGEARMTALEDGFLHVRVTPGVHVLEVGGALPPADTLTLRLGDPPAHVRVSAEGYEVSGVREDGTADDAIELRRLLTAEGERAAVSLPPWFSVTRSFEFATEFRVRTVVERETPPGTPTLVHLPLLASESVHDARIQIRDKTAIVAFGPDDMRLEFDSTLAETSTLQLIAGRHPTHSERWRLACGSMWECKPSGLVPVSHEADGQWQPLYRPWPGERLDIELHKPVPAPGQSTTIDAVKLIVKPGVRATDAELRVSLRTSRGGDHALWLPESARLRTFTVNGERRPVQREGAALGYGVLPGRALVVAQFELSSGMQSVMTVPQVKLDSRAKNARVVVEPPADRWLLWAAGPAWGPAILFWGYFALVLAIAMFLGRLKNTPMRGVDWLLLGLGLTQIDSVEALVVVFFFFVIAWRERTLDLSPWRHNLVQIVVVVWVFAFASALFDAVQSGLLVQPDMQVMGAGSTNRSLQWYVDDTAPALPSPVIISAPLWVYRVLMLAWSLWLARKLLRWAPWVFRAFSAGGLWKKRIKAPKPAPPAVAPAATAPRTSTE